MRGVLTTETSDREELLRRAKATPSLAGADLVPNVTTEKSYAWVNDLETPMSWLKLTANPNDDQLTLDFSAPAVNADGKRFRVVAYDFGMKWNISRQLAYHGCDVTVVPASFPADEVLKLNPDGIFLSNGPGDPSAVSYGIKNVRQLIGETPMFGICLGHQILSLALGGTTYKLKFGHRGANQPVKRLEDGAVEITSQNHGFCVDADSLSHTNVEVSHLNLNDDTVEGIAHRDYPLFSVQYHPEASPGPHDAAYLFERFVSLMRDQA